MATLSIQPMGVGGLTPAYAAATVTTGDKAPTGRGRFLHVKNGGGAPINVTLTTPGTDAYGNAIADKVVAVTNGADAMIPLHDGYRASDGLATFVCSVVTSVTIAAIQA